jgi:rubrerythrin
MTPNADYGRACLSGPPINVDLDRCVAQCPRCGYTFSIIEPDAVCPAHWISPTDGSRT